MLIKNLTLRSLFCSLTLIVRLLDHENLRR